MDLIAKMVGREPSLVRTIYAMNKVFSDIQAFINNSPEYELNNTLGLIEQMSESERQEFDFDVRTIDWTVYCKDFWLGIRRHLLRENDENMAYARIKYERFVSNDGMTALIHKLKVDRGYTECFINA